MRLAAGEHHAVVPVLTAHAEAHPLRERSRAQSMLGPYRACRFSEALAVYQDTRRRTTAGLLERSCPPHFRHLALGILVAFRRSHREDRRREGRCREGRCRAGQGRAGLEGSGRHPRAAAARRDG
ncbi:BTAD domain-containing putative transcriptional regulator [Thermocatellispora tengchongensis]|uniref:BTAD domain-containing putative transcriptional regulator n=1 Tax=Thermocatellispora tengchongensis TaxID=1073253 RepID=UPI0028AB92AE|nr:BTAD domain-containing putative transcriptional regulator [Thermocatellispora tengchongensis]